MLTPLFAAGFIFINSSSLIFASMSQEKFNIIASVIKERRTTKFASMNGNIIPESTMHQLLELANWAPTHGRTQPWYFYIYTGGSLKQFGHTHAGLYKQHTHEDSYKEETYEKLLHAVDKVSHLLVAVMKRGDNPKIPQLEEIAATSVAVQNIMLAATALNIASFWSTHGMTHQPALKEYLQLREEDVVLGLIYMGYTDEPVREGKRALSISERATWNV